VSISGLGQQLGEGLAFCTGVLRSRHLASKVARRCIRRDRVGLTAKRGQSSSKQHEARREGAMVSEKKHSGLSTARQRQALSLSPHLALSPFLSLRRFVSLSIASLLPFNSLHLAPVLFASHLPQLSSPLSSVDPSCIIRLAWSLFFSLRISISVLTVSAWTHRSIFHSRRQCRRERDRRGSSVTNNVGIRKSGQGDGN